MDCKPEKDRHYGVFYRRAFSATADTYFNTCYPPNESNKRVRPDFFILIYQVISFIPHVNYAGSGEQILSKSLSPEQIKLYSNEWQVTSQTPPIFIIYTNCDDGVPPKKSTLFMTL